MSVGNGAAFDAHLDVPCLVLSFLVPSAFSPAEVGVAEKPFNRKLSSSGCIAFASVGSWSIFQLMIR